MYKNPLKGYKNRSKYVERCATMMDGKTTLEFPISNPAKSSRPPPDLFQEALPDSQGRLCYHSPCGSLYISLAVFITWPSLPPPPDCDVPEGRD